MLSSLCLYILHFLYSLAVFATTSWKQLNRQKPQPLTAKRAKLPSHLALLLVSSDELGVEVTERNFVESVMRAVGWCRTVGIEKLTVYDRQGITLNCSRGIQERLVTEHPPSEDDTDSEVEYPLTPPLSDISESRPMSPVHDCQLGVVIIQVSEVPASKIRQRRNVLKRRRPKNHLIPAKPLTLNLVSRESSKPGIASVARSYIQNLSRTQGKAPSAFPDRVNFELSLDDLGSILEGQHGLQPPDFMIVHHIYTSYNDRAPLELYGFPPWQMRLTEMFHNRYQKPIWSWLHSSSTLLLGEEEFRAALDEFSGVQMRLGK